MDDDGRVTGPTFSDVLRAALDPVGVPVGFASGQGEHDQTIVCGDTARLVTSHPGLPWDELGTEPGRCLDLVVDGDRRRGVTEVRLDGMPLPGLLRSHGLEQQADALDTVIGRPVEDAAPQVAAAFAALLAATASDV